MAKFTEKELLLSPEECSLLSKGKEYELIPNQKGMFLLIEKEIIREKENKQNKSVPSLEEEKQQVIGLIRKGKLSELVEGKFEATLDEKQKRALLALVTDGRVFVFKLNETYKKGVYRVKEENESGEEREKKESEDFNAKEKPFHEYTLENDGFLIIKGKEEASNASYMYEKKIKEGLLRGIRSFDGNYYLIENDLLTNYINKIIFALNSKQNQTLDELARTLKISPLLSRIICEFLKEEGELMEKKKGCYVYIK